MKKKLISLIIFSILIIWCLTIESNSVMEIKPGTQTLVNISVSDAYAYCYNLRASNSTLGYNTLDPHLATNADWGAVAYLAVSVYGGNGNASLVSAYKTSGNNSGVMDFGKSMTFVSSYITGSENIKKDYKVNLVENANTKYVDVLTTDINNNKKGLALGETAGWYGSYASYGTTTYSVMERNGFFGFLHCWDRQTYDNGGPAGDITFRPAIWN